MSGVSGVHEYYQEIKLTFTDSDNYKSDILCWMASNSK